MFAKASSMGYLEWKAQLAFYWRWFSNLCAMFLISCLIAWGVISAFSTRGDVVIVTSPVKVLTKQVKAGGVIEFIVSMKRVESCPGEVIQTYFQDNGGAGGSRSFRRRVIDISVRNFENWHYREPVPADISPGPVRYVMTTVSRCPDHVETDTIADFTVEIVP